MINAYLGIFRASEKINWKVILPATIALYIFSPLYSCFFIGYLIAEINKKYDGDYLFGFLRTNKIETIFLLMFFTSATLSAYFRENDYVTCLFASCIVVSVSFSKNLKSFFSSRLSNYLGQISFLLYLIQIPIICSFSSYLYLKLPTLGFDIVTSNLINLFLSLVVSLLLATLLLPLEKISVTYSKKIATFFIN